MLAWPFWQWPCAGVTAPRDANDRSAGASHLTYSDCPSDMKAREHTK